jgi:hypothetical protein
MVPPARYENHVYIKYSNANLDDVANAVSDIDIDLKVDKDLEVTTDLDITEAIQKESYFIYKLSEKTELISVFYRTKIQFLYYKTEGLEVVINLKEDKVSLNKAYAIDCIVM